MIHHGEFKVLSKKNSFKGLGIEINLIIDVKNKKHLKWHEGLAIGLLNYV